MADRPVKKPLPLFALRLRRARLNSVYRGKRMRQVDAANLIGVGHSTYWRWENGDRLPTAANLERVAEVLKVSVDELWLDVGFLPPDMQDFLVMTREGIKVVQNIRKIMEVMEENQQPTTRRNAPVAEKFTKHLMADAHAARAMHRKRVGERREIAKKRVADAEMAPDTP